MRALTAMDPYQDRFEDRCSLLIVRNDRLWLWPLYAPNLHVRYVSLSVVVVLYCIIESLLVYVTAEVLDSPMETLVNFFVSRVYEGASWELVWPFVSVRIQGREVSLSRSFRNDSLNFVLGRYACSAREIHLLIQQRDHTSLGRGPRVVWHNRRAIDPGSNSESGSEASTDWLALGGLTPSLI